MSDFAMLNSALQNAMKKIGTTNGHACPASQDPIDAKLHEYYVAKMGEKFFTDRAKNAGVELLKALRDDAVKSIDDMIAATKKNNAGESAVVAGGQHYVLDFTTRKGSSRIDAAAVKTQLQVQFSLPSSVADKFVETCSKVSEPTKIYSVKPVRD